MDGPAMMFEDCLCGWTGDEMMMHGTLHFEKHLTFTAFLKNFNRKSITLKNVGTSVIYYTWEILRSENSFDNIIPQRKIVKFFFDTSTGVLKPDTTKEIIITFYSREPGLFNETWQFSTRPVLCGGANIFLRLRGASVSDKDNQLEIAKTENYLLHQQVVHIVKTIVYQLIDSIQPVSKHVELEESDVFREEEKFELFNPQLNYHRDVIEELHKIYVSARLFSRPWDLSFDSLESALYDNEKFQEREKALQQVEVLKEKLQHPRLIPLSMGSYHITYILWVQTMDKLVIESINIVRVMNSVIKTRKDLVIVLEKNMVTKPEEFKKSYLDDVIPSELSRLMRKDHQIKKKYHEILYLLTYSLLSEMAESMNIFLEDSWMGKQSDCLFGAQLRA
uniref:MYCBP-associated protein n=1 Tax=Strigamia maritima TaxID=126957 RepID=T1J4I6_STRMM